MNAWAASAGLARRKNDELLFCEIKKYPLDKQVFSCGLIFLE